MHAKRLHTFVLIIIGIEAGPRCCIVMPNISPKFLVCKLIDAGFIVCRLNEFTGLLEQVSGVLPSEKAARANADFRNNLSKENE